MYSSLDTLGLEGAGDFHSKDKAAGHRAGLHGVVRGGRFLEQAEQVLARGRIFCRKAMVPS